MESLQSTSPAAERESAQENSRPDVPAATLRMRLWAYGGDERALRNLVWSEEKSLAELIQKIISSGQGAVSSEHNDILVAHFTSPVHALATAKSLQQRLLGFDNETPGLQVVAAIAIDSEPALPSRPSDGSEAATESDASGILAEANCAQILVSEQIYDAARTIPGFDFSSRPVREAGELAIYELRWTDESTYGHLRKTSRGNTLNVSRERRYTIQSELGRGCMGVVYKAYDEVIGRSVALKTIAVNQSFPNRDELVERLKQEAKAAGSLDHPNIVTIYDVGQEENLLYLSMQLIEGQTLMALLAEGEVPPLMDLLSYAEQICNAVGYAHQKGVIHRDLKPANFMLTSQGMIKVLDFGIAKLEDATLTQTGMIVGTPTYMAPEQAKAKKVDQRTDVFSLGSVFYELFTREKPFKGDVTTVLYKLIHEDPPPPSVINPALPIGIDAIIRKALAKDPAERFQTCEEMRDAFRQQAVLLQQASAPKPAVPAPAQPAPVTVEDLLEEVRPRRSSRRIWPSLVAGVLLAALGVGAWAFRAKVRTGAFPPSLARIFSVLKPKKPLSGSTNSAAVAQKSPDDTSAEASSQHPEDKSSGGNATTVDQNTPPSTAETAQSAAAPVSQPAATATDNAQTQTAPENTSDSTATAAQSEPVPASANSNDPEKNQPAESNPFEPRNKRTQKTSTPAAGDNAAKVDGFSRRDIPDLLSRADAAAGRGDYRLAGYEYGIILRLDRQNAAARSGLHRVQQAQEEQ